jgi:Tol biopolymer transport system component
LVSLALDLTLCSPLLAQEGPDAGKGLPLEPARWANFTTSQGTWLSLDVSPDGQMIAFDLLGDLYTIPIEGGTATRITHGLEHDMQPRFSPDGEHIVFVSDRSGDDNLWVAGADGSDPRQITKDGGVVSTFLSPDWTPDGNYIVVARGTLTGGNEKLWLYHKAGGVGIELTPAPRGLRFQGPAFGADERYVWYAQRSGSWQYNSVFPQYQLGVYDRETGTRTTMSSRYGSAFRPALSPDGDWLTYGTRHDTETGLVLRELDTGETPDSREVVISYGGGIWRVPIDGSDATEIPFTVNAEVAVGPEVEFEYPIEDGPTFTARQIRDAKPSPDGSRIAFSALDRLYVMDLPDGTPQRLTSANVGEFHPVWSPDGASIAYVTWDDAEGHDGGRIVAMRADARNLHESIDPFVGSGLGAEFVWFPSTGGEATVIGPTAGRWGPHFTADPDRIYTYGFVPAADGQPATVALVSTRWDNTDLEQHLRVTWRLPLMARGWEVSCRPHPTSSYRATSSARRGSGARPGSARAARPSSPPTSS